MKIAIAGAGAMGSRFGIMLQRAGNEVVLIDSWQEHVTAINQSGLHAEFEEETWVEKIPAYHQNKIDDTLVVDWVIVFTKALQLEEMMGHIQSLIGEETKVLCLLNGMGHEEVIEKYVPRQRIYMGNTMWTAAMIGPGKVKLIGNGFVELQNMEPGYEKQAKEIAHILTKAGLQANYSEHIWYSIYKKACVNATMNSLCTLLECNMADFGDTLPARAIVSEIIKEFVAVAAYEGIELSYEEMLEHVEKCSNRSTIGEHFPSMYQDLVTNKRLTEIDYINGAIVRKGQKYGIKTPYCELVTQLIHCKEELFKAK